VDPLRPFWDFGDVDASEQRFRALLQDGQFDRAEVLTQLARVAGLRGDFSRAEELLAEAEGGAASPAARVRVALERGRVVNSGGDPAAALPLFEQAYEDARVAGLDFLAADAAHMVAIAAPDRDAALAWTERGLEVAERSEDAAYWAGPLLNNLGWAHVEAGDHEAALDAFERALTARERRPEQPGEIAIARYAVARALRELGRADEAARQLEQAVAWTREAGEPDGWFHEELALAYADLDRPEDAREHAERALVLLPRADPSFQTDEARASRLRDLAAQPLS
jgi:tetratricopeptide (TPR) repeat protein